MEYMPFALNSYIFLLQFAYEHSEQIIPRMQELPIFGNVDRHLSLTNNTINQLNLVANPSLNCKTKFNSLFAVINNTSTTIGKRYLRDGPLNPIDSSTDLNMRYDGIDALSGGGETPIYKYLESYLNKITDLERAHRKMTWVYFIPRIYVDSLTHMIVLLRCLISLTHLLVMPLNHLSQMLSLLIIFLVLVNEIKHDFSQRMC